MKSFVLPLFLVIVSFVANIIIGNYDFALYLAFLVFVVFIYERRLIKSKKVLDDHITMIRKQEVQIESLCRKEGKDRETETSPTPESGTTDEPISCNIKVRPVSKVENEWKTKMKNERRVFYNLKGTKVNFYAEIINDVPTDIYKCLEMGFYGISYTRQYLQSDPERFEMIEVPAMPEDFVFKTFE